MANSAKVRFGLKNVHYAPMHVSEAGVVSWDTPLRFPGAVNLDMAPQGDTNTFYADDVAYYTSTRNDGYQGDLEVALVPDHFAINVLAEKLDSTDKVQVEYADVESNPFALLFQISDDVTGTLFVMYNCTCTRPNTTGKTLDNSKTPNTEKLTITASPMADGKVKARTTAETTETVRNNWFKQVWVPGTSEV